MFEDLFASAETSARGAFWSKLDQETQDLITEFLAQAKLSDKSKASYKSYLAKAIVEPHKLSNDQKSAIRKFKTWFEAR
jgi:hypothetical protein